MSTAKRKKVQQDLTCAHPGTIALEFCKSLHQANPAQAFGFKQHKIK